MERDASGKIINIPEEDVVVLHPLTGAEGGIFGEQASDG